MSIFASRYMSFYDKFKSFWGSVDAVDNLSGDEDSDDNDKDIEREQDENENDQEDDDNNDNDADDADLEDNNADDRGDGNGDDKKDDDNKDNDGDDSDREDDDRDEEDEDEEDPPKIAKPTSLASQVIDIHSEDDVVDYPAVDIHGGWDPYSIIARKNFLSRRGRPSKILSRTRTQWDSFWDRLTPNGVGTVFVSKVDELNPK